MEIIGTATRVTIYIGESDRWHQKPLYLAILEMLKEEGCAGATVLRALGQPPAREATTIPAQPGRHVKVGDVMLRQVPTVTATTSLDDVTHLLITQAQRRVVVVDDDNHVVGIISDGDLLKNATQSERPSLVQALTRRLPMGRETRNPLTYRTAGEVMTEDPITVRPETPMQEALRLLLSHKIKRLPVVDANQRLVGLVGRSEFLQALSRELPAVSE